MITLLDQDIAHIARIMTRSLREDRGGPVLPVEYWRRRLHRLLNSSHLTKIQLRSIDDLLLQLDRFNVEELAWQRGRCRDRSRKLNPRDSSHIVIFEQRAH
jgi:hypothetical protein